MIDFLLGTAVLVLPQGNLPLLAGIGAVKGAGACLGHGSAAADAAAVSRSGSCTVHICLHHTPMHKIRMHSTSSRLT
jgi:hypothetical protein